MRRLSDDYYRKSEAAAVLDVSERGLDRLNARGEGPPKTKIGRRAFYRKSALHEWLKEQEDT